MAQANLRFREDREATTLQAAAHVDRDPSRMRALDQETISRLHALLPNQSKETVMNRLGISSNTWTKIKRGEAVRSILVDRALSRLRNFPV
ncbi:hypothetical protein [Sphingobium ummariense]|uniref:hypothetical protein n=1 Tax=Sphingobium ummariense TaxID=420994 RepID=UPI001268A13A|nr:hypothetical protein [Sphingobium ummariense]